MGFTLAPTAAVLKHAARTTGSKRDHFSSSSLRALFSASTQDLMTSARVVASRKTTAGVPSGFQASRARNRRARCLLRCMSPLMALNGRRWAADQCPLPGVKQTSQFDGAMSANDPKQTSPGSIFESRRCVDSGHSQPLFLFVVFSPNYQSCGASRNRLAASRAIGIESEVTVGAADFRLWE